MMPKPPNLEVVSEFGKRPEPSGERRRVPRLRLGTEQFRLAQNGKLFAMTDVSKGGMGLRILDREDLALFPVGSNIEGTVKLNDAKHEVKARVRHFRVDSIGCQFEDPSEELLKALDEFCDPVRLGQSLKPVPATEAGTLWYHAPNGTDFLMTRGNDGQYRQFTLYVMGNYVQWDIVKGLATGLAQPFPSAASREEAFAAEEWGIMQFETTFLRADPRPDPEKLNVAKTLLLSSNLPQDLKKWCTRQLEVNDNGS